MNKFALLFLITGIAFPAMNLISSHSVLAEDRIFSSPTQFKVCGEDPNFTRPNKQQQVNRIISAGSRFDYLTNNISNPKTVVQEIISRIPGKLYTADSMIFSSASHGLTYESKILSGMWNVNDVKWKCSEALGSKLADMTEKGSVSQIILFGYKIKDIQKKGSFYMMTTSDKKVKGIQYIDIDRKLNGKLKIRTVSGQNLGLVSFDGKPDFGTR